MKYIFALINVAALFFIFGCGAAEKYSVEPQVIYNNYKKVENKPKEIQHLYVNYYSDEKRNQVLNLMRMGLYAYQKGYLQDAEFAFDKSLIHIESLYGETELSEKAKSLWYGEDSKFFVGEPYERVMAYYYRGLLYLEKNDYENARASFKSGLLQDARAEDNQYQADYSSLILLEALTSRANGDDELYSESIKEFFNIYKPTETEDSYSIVAQVDTEEVTDISNVNFKKVDISKVSRIFSRAECLGNNGEIDWNNKTQQYSCKIQTRFFYFTSEQDRSHKYVEQTLAKVSRILSDEECLLHNGKVDWNDKIKQSSCKVKNNFFYYRNIQKNIPKVLVTTNIDNNSIKKLILTEDNIAKSNVFIFIDTGRGPIKTTLGENGSELNFTNGSYSMIPPKVTINEVMQESLQLDDIYFQASTRGGREIDKIIDGKATFKDETKETGEALVTVGAAGLYASATAAMATDNEYVQSAAAVIALVSLTAMAIGTVADATADAMVASADARYWDNLPGGIFLYMNKLPAGKHTIKIQAETLKEIEINVSENSILIKHVMPNIQKPYMLIDEQDIINVVREKDKYETKYQKTIKGEENDETISNKLNSLISDFKF